MGFKTHHKKIPGCGTRFGCGTGHHPALRRIELKPCTATRVSPTPPAGWWVGAGWSTSASSVDLCFRLPEVRTSLAGGFGFRLNGNGPCPAQFCEPLEMFTLNPVYGCKVLYPLDIFSKIKGTNKLNLDPPSFLGCFPPPCKKFDF